MMDLSCPIPLSDYPAVTMAHGGGGRLMNHLIERMMRPAFAAERDAIEEHGNEELPTEPAHDAAVLALPPMPGARLAFTTDSFVVRPLFFPGGDIGSLAVHGTVNDLAMAGARPLWLSAGFILEEGLPMETLWRVVRSMASAARAAEVRVVTGDTKVVERGRCDGVYLNTAGVGVVEHARDIGPASVAPGDAVILSGDLGRHGMAVMAVREGLEFESAIVSDSASLWPAVRALLDAGVAVHCLRDLTRGGLASALNEIAAGARCDIAIDERRVPVDEQVRGACEILGLDPLYVANEGRFVAFVPEEEATRAVELLRRIAQPEAGKEAGPTTGACLIGRVGAMRGASGMVTLRSTIGAERVLDMLSGEQLPRIC